ncbi:CXXC-type zinc finger protein 1 [Drosophila takahashii]|uniref:CXXC-type zinc finger protein 1 n=1 Tax=Drosophila takahashii TaxID=29030 RepID=UPI0038996D5F
MPAVHKRANAEDVQISKEPEENIYCVCRQSYYYGFMIACDKCEEWFHGECIGLDPDNGNRYDNFFCEWCLRKDPLLKCTFKSNPPNPMAQEVTFPEIAKIIQAESFIQPLVTKKTNFQKPETPKKCREKKKAIKAVKKLEVVKKTDPKPVEKPLAVAEKVDPKPVDSAKKTDPKPVNKSYESRASQCNLFRELVQQTSNKSGNLSKKRGICFAFYCNEIARPESRYCCDDCGTFTALTNAFAVAPLMTSGWGLGSDGFRSKDVMVQSNLLAKIELKKKQQMSNKSSQPTETEMKIEPEAKKSRDQLGLSSRRKSMSSRYHSPIKSTNNLSSGISPAKKPKLQAKPTPIRSGSSEKASSGKIDTLPHCASPKSSRSVKKMSQTVPNSPSYLRKTSIQKTPSITSHPSTATKDTFSSHRKLSSNAKVNTAQVKTPSQSKTTHISRMATPVTSPKKQKSMPVTTTQRISNISTNGALQCEPTKERRKSVGHMVSHLIPKQSAYLARKRMMMKLAG